MSLPIELWTDGSSLSNPGPSGWAYVCQYTPITKDEEMPIPVKIEKSQGYRLSTNNRMEMMAIINGVKEAMKCIDEKLSDSKAIITFSDSQYYMNNRADQLAVTASNNASAYLVDEEYEKLKKK